MHTTLIRVERVLAGLLVLLVAFLPLDTVAASDGTAAPTFDVITDATVAEGESASVRLTANDPDGDAVTFTIDDTVPDFVSSRSIRDGRLLLTVSPDVGDAGTYGPFDITASDGEHDTTALWYVTVTAADPDADDDPDPDPDPTCDATPGALQDIIDGHVDGVGIEDPKIKLVDAADEGYILLELDDACFADQGEVHIDGRSGLWVRRFEATGTTLVIENSSFITISGFTIDGLVVTDSDNVRVEAAATGSLTVTNGIDYMMGKMDISGPTLFDSMSRVVSGRSFARSSTFTTVEITGVVAGFSLEASTLDAEPVVSCDPCTNLGLKSLTHP